MPEVGDKVSLEENTGTVIQVIDRDMCVVAWASGPLKGSPQAMKPVRLDTLKVLASVKDTADAVSQLPLAVLNNWLLRHGLVVHPLQDPTGIHTCPECGRS